MVVIVNGLPQSGKSSFVELCCQIANLWNYSHQNGRTNIYEYSTVDFVKDIAMQCGWDGQKTPNDRKFLSNLKQILTEWNDIPFKQTHKFILNCLDLRNTIKNLSNEQLNTIIFIHCREPEQIQRFKEQTDIGLVYTLLIERRSCDNDTQSNSSDANVKQYQYDEVITNDGTLGDLSLQAEDFLKKCIKLEEEYATSNSNSASI